MTPRFHVALPPLYERFDILARYVGHLLRFLAAAIVLIAVAVVALRQIGMEPGEVRSLLPTYVLAAVAAAAGLAVVTTWVSWRRRRPRRRY